MTSPASSPHADGILAAVRAAGLRVGDGERPRDLPADPNHADWQPYLVLWFDFRGRLDGSIAEPDVEILGGSFTLTAIGRLAAEARHVADQAVAALESGGFAVAGRRIDRVRRSEPIVPVQHDLSVEPPVFYAPCRFTFNSFPA